MKHYETGFHFIFSGMASNYMYSDTSSSESQQPSYPPLNPTEREQLRAHENVDLILAWALVKNIVLHPEVLDQIRIKSIQVKKHFLFIMKKVKI